jgi:hypothetical protein
VGCRGHAAGGSGVMSGSGGICRGVATVSCAQATLGTVYCRVETYMHLL